MNFGKVKFFLNKVRGTKLWKKLKPVLPFIGIVVVIIVIFCVWNQTRFPGCDKADDGEHIVNGEVVYVDAKAGKCWTPTAEMKYTWSTTAEKTGKDWGKSCVGQEGIFEACQYCDNLDYAGFTDWRLPTCDSAEQDDNCELWTLYNNQGSLPWEEGNKKEYWSSTQQSGYSAIFLWFKTGSLNSQSKKESKYVRCIRD